ncbi:hypothetical protein FRC09_013330 [Ceratobasidium sp. 395]|nr:hypothetical protein FRC09_013330 [Ceratobasidium sp. 395]
MSKVCAAAGIQLAHSGRKTSTLAPWDQNLKTQVDEAESERSVARDEEGGWVENVLGSSNIPFSETYPSPES